MSYMSVRERVPRPAPPEPISIRMPHDDRKRLRQAALQADMPLGRFIMSMLDERDSRAERAGRLKSSPLHVGRPE